MNSGAPEKKLHSSFTWRHILVVILLIPYLLYLFFIIQADTGPIDFETIMRIGGTFAEGGKVYGENSYYPLPYVFIFSVFSALPRSIAMAIWLGAPVVMVLLISGFRPFVLLFAPTISHFFGGQTAVFGLLGFWGYRENLDETKKAGGVWLALTLLKPQLGLVPLAYALWRWLGYYKRNRKIPAQFLAFVVSISVIYIPSLILNPSWPLEWLSVPRPMFQRALSGLLPRLLLQLFPSDSIAYWSIWLIIAIALLILVLRLKRRGHLLDILVLWGFVVSPLVHDYDLLQVIPILVTPLLEWGALLLSLPGWWTILFQYANDSAWVTFTIIAPGILVIYLLEHNPSLRQKVGVLNLIERRQNSA
jgi:hypothetical protein